ncbi:MAG: MBOAT family protein [Planctomycetota bacterium]
MLFNSYTMICVFLPIVVAGYYAFKRYELVTAAKLWLIASSFTFYAAWKPSFLLILWGSIAFNYTLGRLMIAAGDDRASTRRWLMLFGVVGNLGLLFYFKYANFFIEEVTRYTGLDIANDPILLPLAISFFTFQQIAYLADIESGRLGKSSLVDYMLFVTFFPQLIAGPIVHHKQVMPQFEGQFLSRRFRENVSVGLTIFAVGLFKKVMLADNLEPTASRVFDAADGGAAITTFDAWLGLLSYSFQIYFDFSGYSDMAIGLALLFGVRLPLNFNSPYKASNISDFWRRWHITLSVFLRDYLYIPLGGNRRGEARRSLNLLMTMLIGGLWHGAGWNFVIWGGLHGVYLTIHHAFSKWLGADRKSTAGLGAGRIAGVAVTFLAVMVAWVFFRAVTLEGAMSVLAGTVGVTEAGLGAVPAAWWPLAWLAIGAFVVWVMPNTQQWVGYSPDPSQRPGGVGRADEGGATVATGGLVGLPAWRASLPMACVVGAMFALAFTQLARPAVFIYFQF